MALDPYWEWFEATLKAPERAVGGEPCRICSEPVPAKAPWKYRDRHVCSARCNQTAIRRMKAAVKRGDIPGYTPPDDLIDRVAAELLRDPRTFATDPAAPFPYEHALFPVEGDVIERHGHRTAYVPVEEVPYAGSWVEGQVTAWLEGRPTGRALGVVHLDTDAWTVWLDDVMSAHAGFSLARVFLGTEWELDASPAGTALRTESGATVHTGIEKIDGVIDGREYRWEAWVFSAAPLARLWTPERTELSQQRSRITQARSSYRARMRALGVLEADAEHIDPRVVYERDGWTCQLCGEPVDRAATWPDPWVATLDHVRAVTRGGAHAEDNVQCAHWICNLLKGNRAS